MSIICVRDGIMAADKRSVLNGRATTVTKIFRRRDWLLGIAGDLVKGLELVQWFEDGAAPKGLPEFQRSLDTYVAMVGLSPEGRIHMFENSHEPFVVEEPFFAIGCGRDFALTALYLNHSAIDAVAVTCMLDTRCGNGVDALRLNPQAKGVEDVAPKEPRADQSAEA